MRHKSKIKLLIADNDENVLIALERMFEDEGYATTTVVSQKQLSVLLSEDEFDLVVLDDYLSDGDSVEVLTRIRCSGMRPLVIVTFNRYPARDQRARLRDLGASAFVNKCAYPEMVDIVRHLLAPRPGVCVRRDDFNSIT